MYIYMCIEVLIPQFKEICGCYSCYRATYRCARVTSRFRSIPTPPEWVNCMERNLILKWRLVYIAFHTCTFQVW